jgi:hypothetical protein
MRSNVFQGSKKHSSLHRFRKKIIIFRFKEAETAYPPLARINFGVSLERKIIIFTPETSVPG